MLLYICFRDEIFENPKAGASSDSTKVLVLITDGDPSDEDDIKIVKKYDAKKIIRFVIGVSSHEKFNISLFWFICPFVHESLLISSFI